MIIIFVVLFLTVIQVNLLKFILVFQTMHFIKVFPNHNVILLFALFVFIHCCLLLLQWNQSWEASTLCFGNCVLILLGGPKRSHCQSLSVVLKCHFRVQDPLTTKFMIKSGYLICHVQFNWTNTWYIVIFGLEGNMKCNLACASSFPESPVLKMSHKMSMGSKQWQIFALFNLF